MSYKRFIIFKQQILSKLTQAKVVFLVQEREIHNKIGILNSVLIFTIIGSRLVLHSVYPERLETYLLSSVVCLFLHPQKHIDRLSALLCKEHNAFIFIVKTQKNNTQHSALHQQIPFVFICICWMFSLLAVCYWALVTYVNDVIKMYKCFWYKTEWGVCLYTPLAKVCEESAVHPMPTDLKMSYHPEQHLVPVSPEPATSGYLFITDHP